ncbi:tryptophan-rich sensory protein [Cecembia calidifontis]|jgi:hypothetical protein|uniref:TspO/MBR related protein n=1 Tax=Cecembia calidifontis TaxID=1187080 RepID=A0A4Q7PEX7_9BACT|nr:tryptophan-rich sensory protein [Cecembia calidifontis]RZS98687.1 TspO/MBR related protein [Cecembia calidifontis]
MKNFLLLALNTLTFFGTLFLNYLYGSGAGGRKSVGEISNQYDTLITPAGYAFSIWGVIYLLLLGFITYQWIGFFKGRNNSSLEPTSFWFAVSNMLNGLWIVVWVNEMLLLSVLIITGLLISLLLLGKSLKLGYRQDRREIFIGIPISVYFGWIIVATVVNVSVWFYDLAWFKGQEVFITILILLVASMIYAFLSVKKNLSIPSFVGIWAFLAIAFKQINLNPGVAYAAILFSVGLLIGVFITLKNKKLALN